MLVERSSELVGQFEALLDQMRRPSDDDLERGLAGTASRNSSDPHRAGDADACLVREPLDGTQRDAPGLRIGDDGPMGRLLVRGSAGHEIVPELAPVDGEVVLDKPGKDAFYATDLEAILRASGITHLIVTGVTTEVCVQTTVRAANDRGFECLVLSDCTGSYFPEFHQSALAMFAAQGGIVGWVGTSTDLIDAIAASDETRRA